MNESANEPLVLLLDLSGNEGAARAWAAPHFPHQTIRLLNKADLKWSSKREALTSVRALRPQTFALFTNDIDLQSSRGSMLLFGALTGAHRLVFGDRQGQLIARSRFSVFALEAPRLALELLFGYAVIIPLSWLLTVFFGFALRFRNSLRRLNAQSQNSNSQPLKAKTVEANNHAEISPSPRLPFSLSPSLPHSLTPSLSKVSQTALYIRATLTSAKEGGLMTHVAGFTGGAQAAGHRLQFVVSGTPTISSEQAQVDLKRQSTATLENAPYAIKPSARVSATRALFELWNNLVFTAKSLRWLHHDADEKYDFIYQRYSRFNWTGVVLSVFTGLPLALEFNGSEVWVSRSWDPVGQLALLERFERLNQRAADFIFTVSTVERDNLIGAGVAANKIIVNPNGVDTEKFHKGCGGAAIRQQLGIEEKIVVGFLGTFGPWHGAPVLAEAALKVQSNCHFLFLGDGDERAISEAKFISAKERATFTGRIAYDKVAAYLDACDILVAPHVAASDGSEFFGSPTKLFEYLAMARPVVASRLGQMTEVIADKENGLLVESGDADSLAQAIDRLANDEVLRHCLGAAARKTVVENYTWQHNAARVFDTLEGR
ncbi:MAG: glycosyltransferase family 4 protein [Acidobacteria bacterium]|nr:glycosyltransferase family 4 protein [Acidobacteriota bacterium]